MCTYFSFFFFYVSSLGLVVGGRLFLELVRRESMEMALVMLQNISIYFNVLDNTRSTNLKNEMILCASLDTN